MSATKVQVIRTKLPWEVLGALPEMLQTAWGPLFRSLRLARGVTLLVRDGTTSVGLAAAAIAKNFGAIVSATTRNPDRTAMLQSYGAAKVFVDMGKIASTVRETYPKGTDKVLELIGTTTLEDRCVVCAKPGSCA